MIDEEIDVIREGKIIYSNEFNPRPVCPHCREEGQPPHVCPFQQDINDNYTVCTCCRECSYQCAMDI